MAAPTQELPSWLSYVTTTITDDSGNPITTSSTLVYLPLTYYGPSIPLGPDWTYGGLTSPASTDPASETSTEIPETSTPTTTSVIPPSTSAIPSSTLSISSSLTPSSTQMTLSSTANSSLPPTTSSTTTSSSSSSSGGLERGQLIGIIVGSILGAIAILLLALLCYLRRRRHSPVASRSLSPIDSEPVIITVEDAFSPRTSGEEADPFLQPSSARTRQRLSANTGSLPSSHSSGASGYGIVLDRPTLAVPETQYEQDQSDQPLHPWQLHSLAEEESVLPPDEDEFAGHHTEFGLAMLPPRVVQDKESDHSFQSRRTQRSSYALDGDEPAMLATARRVRVDGPHTSPETRSLPLESLDPGPSSARNPGRGSSGLLGLTGLAGLGRFSWFNNLTSSSRRNSTADRDVESGASDALLSDAPPEMYERRQPRLVPPGMSLGLTDEGVRPLSNVSAKSTASAATVYHDAQSSISGSRGTPRTGQGTPVLTSPPRALASTSHGELAPSSWIDTSHHAPMTSGEDPMSSEPYTGPRAITGNVDILDMPAPRGISPFASSSSTKVAASMQEPAHVLTTPKSWEDTRGYTPSMGSFAGYSDTSTKVGGHGINIDVLEDEPPAPGDMWKSMASVFGIGSSGSGGGFGPAGTRTTFGMPRFVDPLDITSEQGSLHSMRSHLSPHSSRSAGSAPASRRDGSGSTDSHPRSKSTNSHTSSLNHSNSITSDGRRRRNGPISPALSAFGTLSSPEPVHLTDLEPTSAVIMDERHSSPTDRSQSPPLSPLLMSPWVGGLDKDWQAA